MSWSCLPTRWTAPSWQAGDRPVLEIDPDGATYGSFKVKASQPAREPGE